MQGFDFRHHVSINRQPTGSIDKQHVNKAFFGFCQSRPDDCFRLLRNIAREEFDTSFSSQTFQLLDRCRTVDVGTDYHDRFLLVVLQPQCQLGNRGGLTGTLQASHQNNRWRNDLKVQFLIGRAHQVLQFGLNNFQEGLPGIETGADFLANGTGFYLLDKVLDHRQGHISFQQCPANFTQAFLDIIFCNSGFAANTF